MDNMVPKKLPPGLDIPILDFFDFFDKEQVRNANNICKTKIIL